MRWKIILNIVCIFLLLYKHVTSQIDVRLGAIHNIDSALKMPNYVGNLQIMNPWDANRIKDVAKLKNLESLSITSVDFKSFPVEILSLSKLKYLVIDFSHIPSIPKDISLLNQLEIIGLQSNLLRNLPLELFEIKSLKTIDVTMNRFSYFKRKKYKKIAKKKGIDIYFKIPKKKNVV